MVGFPWDFLILYILCKSGAGSARSMFNDVEWPFPDVDSKLPGSLRTPRLSPEDEQHDEQKQWL